MTACGRDPAVQQGESTKPGPMFGLISFYTEVLNEENMFLLVMDEIKFKKRVNLLNIQFQSFTTGWRPDQGHPRRG